MFTISIAAGLGFIKIEGRTLTHIILSAFNFYWRPRTYVWQTKHPQVKKDGAAIKSEARGIPIESIISGESLRNIWEKLQTGAKISDRQFFQKAVERYQILQRITGERRAARRVDYR